MTAEILLETQVLTRNFGQLVAVNAVSLRVYRGEKVALIGPNGAGKTTLFNLITNKLAPTSGQVHFKGQDITNLPPHVISQHGLARSFQLNNLFPELSAFENMRIATQARHARRRSLWLDADVLSDTADQAQSLLKEIGLTHQAHLNAETLSYGDQRHLEIGLALATKPDLLLLDEPTSGMSPHETRSTVKLIQHIAQRVSVLLIEHDMNVVMSVCDRIVVMHHGQVLAVGSPEEIERNQAVQKAYLGVAQ